MKAKIEIKKGRFGLTTKVIETENYNDKNFLSCCTNKKDFDLHAGEIYEGEYEIKGTWPNQTLDTKLIKKI